MRRKGAVHIGTSGWHYEHWRGPFYPPDLPPRRWLEYYVRRLRTAEINNSFYGLPSEKTLKAWRETVPPGFFFAVKASRYITHMKKLKDPREPLSTFLGRMEALGEAMGPVLFQLPPRWRCDPERLEVFLSVLPAGIRCAFEFRDTSWFRDEVYEILERRGAAFCIYELDRMISPKKVTADFVYVRLHGPEAAYRGEYSTKTLSGWAGAFSSWSRGGRDVYCYFDNDQSGYAARDAVKLRKMMEGG